MKILVVGNYFYPEHVGGVEIVVFNLVRHYREAGHDVVLTAADVPPRFRGMSSDDLPIRSWNITEERLGFPAPIPTLSSILKLYRSVRECEVVHLHDCLYLINIIVFLFAKILTKPILITQHTEVIPYENKIKKWLHSISLRTIGVMLHKYASRTVFISENTRDNLPFITNVAGDPVVIKNGVDTDFFEPLHPDVRRQVRQDISGDIRKPIILFVGRFVAIKGIQHLIPIIKKRSEWHWLLVGRPDEYDPSIWNFPNMTFWPSLDLDNMRLVYAAADLLIHPSEVVGMSLTVLECMACGTPVMVNESVLYGVQKEDREYFIPVDADARKIENAIDIWLGNPSKQSRFTQKVRDFTVKQSNWRESARQYLLILDNITKNV